MAIQKEYSMIFKLAAQLGPQFLQTFKSAQSELSSTQKELQALKKPKVMYLPIKSNRLHLLKIRER